MNHKDIRMILRYAKLSNVNQQIAADKLAFLNLHSYFYTTVF